VTGFVADGNCECVCLPGHSGAECSAKVLTKVPCTSSQVTCDPTGGGVTGFVADDNCECECLSGYGGTSCSTKEVCTTAPSAATCARSGGQVAGFVADDDCECVCPAWKDFPKLPEETAEVTTAIVGDTMVLIGGYTCKTMVCDLTDSRDTWSFGAQRPDCNDHIASAVVGDAAYFIGGDMTDSIQRFVPASNKWKKFGGYMPEQETGGSRKLASANIAVVGQDVYMCGGYNRGFKVTNCWKKRFPESSAFDFTGGNNWEKMPPLLAPVHHAAGGTDGVWFFIFGGKSRKGNGNDCGEQYTQAWKIDSAGGGEWKWKKSSDVKRGGMGNAPYINNEFYVIGGESQGCTNVHLTKAGTLPQVRIYNPETDTWRDGLDVTGMHGVYPVADVKRQRILLPGGGPKGGVSKSNYAFQLLATDLANRSAC